MAHWKKLHNPDYLGAYSLYGDDMTARDLVVTIKSVARQTVVGAEGKKDDCIVAQLDGQKPMILNATNCKTLTKLFGSPDTNAWTGKPLTLYVANLRIKGEETDCLRIRSEAPKPQKQILTADHPNWNDAVNGLANGDFTIEKLYARFEISEQVKTQLVDAAATAI